MTTTNNNKDEEVLTLTEFVQQNEKKLYELEVNARHQAEAGWGDVDKCTYDEGYVEQPIYSCTTCAQKLGKRFGFCFGCSMQCHLEHDVIELFDKRHFRCDCPAECDATKCQLHETVVDQNTENAYNHNFDGLYCWCRKPYDHDSDDVMIQCVLCQDWFHDTCIQKNYKATVPASKKNDLICLDCTEKYPFLGHYLSNEQSNKPAESSSEKVAGATAESFIKVEDVKSDGSTDTYFEKVQTSNNSQHNNTNQAEPTKENGANNQAQQTSDKCLIEDKELSSDPIGNVFYVRGWRAQLCRCSKCKAMYQLLGVQFLIEDAEPEGEDEEDDNEDDETEVKDANEQANVTVSVPTPQISSLLPDMPALMNVMKRKLNHVQQIEMAETLDNFREAFKEFVKPFAETGQVVTQEDVNRFMEQMATGRDIKRRRL
jgi:E3 ubiquitin-protein ligase UBR7